jgi:hypothetical protein
VDVRRALVVVAGVVVVGLAVRAWRGKSAPPGASSDAGVARWSAPIAAAHLDDGTLFITGLDGSAIRLRRIARDGTTTEREVISDVAASPDADLKLAASDKGLALTWHGLRHGKLVRELVLLGSDLAPRGESLTVAAASCATRDAFWTSDGTTATSHAWSGANTDVTLPKDRDASLLCGAHQAFAVLEGEDQTELVPLPGRAPITLVRESDFGDDEQRELSEYTVADDVGVVRLGGSGAIAIREWSKSGVGPLHKLRTRIGREDDVVAVDASPRFVAIVYTQDSEGSGTAVHALRVDRATFAESAVVLAEGRAGHEVGPFFTAARGDDVAIAWPERSGGEGKARAPVVALSNVRLSVDAKPALARIEKNASTIVDAGCAPSGCWAVALVDGAPVIVPYSERQ